MCLFRQFTAISFTDDNVIIVIGGDDNYKDEDEENKTVLSRWAWEKISSQFDGEYLDGRKSFVFSWDEKHREIHEEALLHYFDQNKKGEKFEPKPKATSNIPDAKVTPGTDKVNKENTILTTKKVNPRPCNFFPRFHRLHTLIWTCDGRLAGFFCAFEIFQGKKVLLWFEKQHKVLFLCLTEVLKVVSINRIQVWVVSFQIGVAVVLC